MGYSSTLKFPEEVTISAKSPSCPEALARDESIARRATIEWERRMQMGERFLSVDHGMVGHATGPGFPSLCPLTFGVAFLSGLNTVPIMSTRLFLLLSVLAFGLWAGAAPAQEEKNVLPDPNGIYFQFAIYFGSGAK